MTSRSPAALGAVTSRSPAPLRAVVRSRSTAQLVAGLHAGLVLGLAGALTTGLLTASPASAHEPPVAPARIVTGWLTGGPSSVPDYLAQADLFSEVSPFWFSVRWDARKQTTRIASYLPAADRRRMLSGLRSGRRAVLPTVVDATPARRMASVLRHRGARATHVRQLVALVTANGFDGIDLDYERFAFSDGVQTWASTRPAWDRFVRELAAALHARGKLLAITVPPMCDTARRCGGRRGYWVYDTVRVARYVDRVRIMAYDYSWDRPGPISPDGWARAIATYAAKHIDRRKLQIGAAAYGRNWVRRDTGDANGNGRTDDYYLTGTCPSPANGALERAAYRSITARSDIASVDVPGLWAKRGRPRIHWDATAKERWFRYAKTEVWRDARGRRHTCVAHREVWYADASATTARVKVVGSLGLAGLAFWSIGAEDRRQWSTLRTYAQSLARKAVAARVSAPRRVTFGATVALGITARRGGTALAGARARLQSWRVDDAGWRAVASGRTDARGVARFRVAPQRTARWRVVVTDRTGAVLTTSPAVTVGVRTAVRVGAPGTSQRGAPMRVRVRLEPKAFDLPVRLQTWDGRHWRTIASGATRGGQTTLLSAARQRAGRWTYRVVTGGSARRLAGYSAPFVVRTR